MLACCLAFSAVSVAMSSAYWARSASKEGRLLGLSGTAGGAAAVLAAAASLLRRPNRLHARPTIS